MIGGSSLHQRLHVVELMSVLVVLGVIQIHGGHPRTGFLRLNQRPYCSITFCSLQDLLPGRVLSMCLDDIRLPLKR